MFGNFKDKYRMISSQICGTDASARQECFRILVGTPQLVLLQQSLYGPVSAPLLDRAEKLAAWHSLSSQHCHQLNIIIVTWVVF